jgi:hypothetical protein
VVSVYALPMTILTDLTVTAPQNVGLICPNVRCGRAMTRFYWTLVRPHMNEGMQCEYCNTSMADGWDFNAACQFEVESTSAPLLDVDTALNASWFHATSKENWAEAIVNIEDYYLGNLYIHAGTREAAMERISDEMANASHLNRSYFLHEIKLTAGTTMAPHILSDTNDWPNTTKEEYDRYSRRPNNWDSEIRQWDSARYVNRWEIAGSLSILVDATKIQVVNTKKLA